MVHWLNNEYGTNKKIWIGNKIHLLVGKLMVSFSFSGLNDIAEEGTYKWAFSNAPLDFQYWNTCNAPSSDSSKNCGMIKKDT